MTDPLAERIALLRAQAALSPSQAPGILALADRLEEAGRLAGAPRHAAAPAMAPAGRGRSKKSSGLRSTRSAAARSSSG